MRKKGQMEIMGLVVIVILLSLAMLFVLQFVLLKEPSQTKKTYTHSQLSANTLNALLKTTTSCRGQDVTQLLQDCASYRPDGLIQCETGQRSCSYVKDTILVILNGTLDYWNKDYLLTADLAELEFSQGSCLGERQSRIYPIPVEGDIMNIRLDICG